MNKQGHEVSMRSARGGEMVASKLSRISGWWAAGLLALALCFSVLPAQAQNTGRVSGFVKDQSGAVVPGASVVLKDIASGTELRTTTDASGFYSLDFVPPKTYSLIVSTKGFKTYTRTNLAVEPAARLNADVTLELGTQVQTVEVQGTAVNLIPTTSGAETPVIGAKQIENLSTEGRNSMELLTLLPGVVNVGGDNQAMFNSNFGTSTGQGISQFNINGLRNDQNAIRLDNANIIDAGSNSGFAIDPNMDMVQEFSVKTSSFEADQGGAGLIVDAVTKSGGSKIHGMGYYYVRNAVFNSNDWTNNALGIAKPSSKFNYPGFNIGGPVRLPGTDFNKNDDKMFFFAQLEWQRQLPDFGSQGAVVPSTAMRNGDFSELLSYKTCDKTNAAYTGRALNMPCQLLAPPNDPRGGWSNTPLPGNILPVADMNANSAKLLTEYPYPNYYDPSGLYNFIGHPLYSLNRTEQNFRVDYNLTQNMRMYVRLGRNGETMYFPWGLWSGIASGWTSNVPEPTPTIGHNLGQDVNLNIVNVINPTLTNEVQFNATEFVNPNHYVDPSKLSKSAVGFKFSGMLFKNGSVPAFANGQSYKGDEMPQISDQWNYYNGGNPGTGRWGEGDVADGIFAANTNLEVLDNVTKVYRTHTLKFGVDIQRNRKDQNGGPVTEGMLITAENWGGYTTGNSFGDILADSFPNYSQGMPNPEGLWRFTNAEWYAQDSWKATRKLTLNYGVRFAWMQPWNEVRGHSTTFIPARYDPTVKNSFLNGIATGAAGTLNDSGYATPAPIALPRFGFAYDIFGTGKTVIRGGGGIYVSRDQGNVSFYQASSDPWAFSSGIGSSYQTLQQYEAADPFGAVGNIALTAEDYRDANQPQTYEWNFTVDQDIGLKTVLEAAYVGNVSRHLNRNQDINLIQPGAMWVPGTTDCCIKGDTNSSHYTPYQPYGPIKWSTHSDTANYNALQVTVRRNVSHGLTLLGSYTWSKTLGYATTFQSSVDPFNSKRDYNLLPWDRAEILNLSYIYQLPNEGAKYFSGSRVAKGILDDWQFSGIMHLTGGMPVTLNNPTVNCVSMDPTNLCRGGAFDNGQSSFQGSGVGWYGTPDLISYNTTNAEGDGIRPIINWKPGGFTGPGSHWFNASGFGLPSPGQFGTFETPVFRGPSNSDWDMTLFKSFSLGESRRLEFRFAAFNVFNHANLNTGAASFNVNPVFDWVLPVGAQHFSDGHYRLANGNSLGVVTERSGHREIEAAVKLFF